MLKTIDVTKKSCVSEYISKTLLRKIQDFDKWEIENAIILFYFIFFYYSINYLVKVNLKIEGQRCCVIAYSSYVQYLCQLDLHEFSL